MAEAVERKRKRLIVRYVAIMTAIALVSVSLFGVVSYRSQIGQLESQMLAEARVLSLSVKATWDFMDYEQANINTDRDGSYNFKGLYCSLVGKSVGKLFSESTDYQYTLRYTRIDPRNNLDRPDEFELRALESFVPGEQREVYGTETDGEGGRNFRYVGSILLTENCLQCHGEPAGELDITGFAKEGLAVGDVGGAVSITMPMDAYLQNVWANVGASVLFFVAFLTVALGVSTLFFRRSVLKPLARLDAAMDTIGKGNMDVDVGRLSKTREIYDLARRVGTMADELGDLYGNLENRVKDRTRQYEEANALLEEQRRQADRMNDLLVEANEKLNAENQYRSNIIAMLSHELRTPLTAILAHLDLLEECEDALVEGGSDKEQGEGRAAACGREHGEERDGKRGEDCGGARGEGQAAARDRERDKEREYLAVVRAHSNTLLEMVNNALSIARIDSGKAEPDLTVVDLIDLLEGVASEFCAVAQRKGIAFETRIESGIPLVLSDWAQLTSILRNLVGNAVKFTEQGGNVATTIEFVPETAGEGGGVADGAPAPDGANADAPDGTAASGSGSMGAAGGAGAATPDGAATFGHAAVPGGASRRGAIVCTVRDTGIGIAEEDLGAIFDRFVQVDSSNFRKYGGSGLGLSLVKKASNMLGGDVRVESELGVGSEFVVSIPAEAVDWSVDEE